MGAPKPVAPPICSKKTYGWCGRCASCSNRRWRLISPSKAAHHSRHFAAVIADRAVAATVARHKSHFFIERAADGQVIDYAVATAGHLNIVPSGDARAALAADYAAMLADEVMVSDAMSFDELLAACADLQDKVNRAASSVAT